MTVLAVAFLVCAVVLLIAVLLLARRLDRRVAALAEPHGDDSAAPPTYRVDAMLAELESDAEGLRIDRDRLAAALHAVADGVMVVGHDREVLVSNAAASRFAGARHSDAVAAQAIAELLDQALLGQAAERELVLFGPPKQTLHLRAFRGGRCGA